MQPMSIYIGADACEGKGCGAGVFPDLKARLAKRNECAAMRHDPAQMLYIDPVECIDCGACVPVCPVSAIFALDDLPEKWKDFTARNAQYYGR